jgi:hypothetical protein
MGFVDIGAEKTACGAIHCDDTLRSLSILRSPDGQFDLRDLVGII